MFHHCPTTDDYGAKTIQFVNEVIRPAINAKFGFPADRTLRLAVIYQDSPYGKGVLSAVNDTITKNDLPIRDRRERGLQDGRERLQDHPDLGQGEGARRHLPGRVPERTGADDDPGTPRRGARHALPRGRVQRRRRLLQGARAVRRLLDHREPVLALRRPEGPDSRERHRLQEGLRGAVRRLPRHDGRLDLRGRLCCGRSSRKAGTTDKAKVRRPSPRLPFPSWSSPWREG